MLPTSLLLALTLTAAPPSFNQLRADGTRAYQAKNWKEACRAFQAAAQLDEKHAPNQADLGLCLGKLGKKEEAIAAQRKAVALGERKLRLQAYYNLSRLGVKLPLPEVSVPPELPHKTRCGRVAQDACGAVHACTYVEDQSGTGVENYSVGVLLGKDESALQRAADAAFRPGSSSGEGEGEPPPEPMRLELESWSQDRCREMDYCRDLDEAACKKALEGCGKPDHQRNDCIIVSADACSGRVGGVCGKTAFELPGDVPYDP